MKERWKSEKEQWIPWEISYSLRETARNDRTSRRNGVLAVVLPDRTGSYNYAIESKNCCPSGCNFWHTNNLFWVLRENMFNQSKKTRMECDQGDSAYRGWPSYIHMVRWKDFIERINYWVTQAECIQNNKEDYDIKVNMPDGI